MSVGERPLPPLSKTAAAAIPEIVKWLAALADRPSPLHPAFAVSCGLVAAHLDAAAVDTVAGATGRGRLVRYTGWATYTRGHENPTDSVREFLGPNAGPGLVIAVTHRYTQAVNTVLNPLGVFLYGETFYAEPTVFDRGEQEVADAFHTVDLAAIVETVERDRTGDGA